MLVFATSDKGGTGRSVTSSNLLFRTALTGASTCYVDFDFGSPTAGAIFDIDALSRGTTTGGGMHAYLLGKTGELEFRDAWKESDRNSLRHQPPGSGRMMLLPGDAGGAEFRIENGVVDRCRALFSRLEEEFDLSIIDLSAGRSYALSMVLAATGGSRPLFPDVRWLVFHRWTRQHVLAAGGLVYEPRGILSTATRFGHNSDDLRDRVRFVRTAVIDPNADDLKGLRPAQLAWLHERDHELNVLAGKTGLGRAMLLGSVPLDPVLQWHEQLLTHNDLWARAVANPATVEAFTELARKLRDDEAWEPM